LKIAYCSDFYATQRLVIGQIKNAKYIRIFTLSRYIFVLLDILKKIGFYSHKWYFYFSNVCFGIFNKKNIDCVHFFNQISLDSSVSWISQFETQLPRYKTPTLGAIKAIADKKCKAILPLSECAYNIELYWLAPFPEYKDEIVAKMYVLHPPQKLLIDDMTSKIENDKLTFIFIGNDFFQKGGMEMLNALEKFSSSLVLIIISRMNINDYVTCSTIAHKRLALDFFTRNRDWIDYYDGLPNVEVLQLVKKSDVGLLPTKADTYGYSVLEMQAAGVPVISTDVRALPEINNDECGWLIPVTKNNLGEALFSNEHELSNLSREIENGLYSILAGIISEYEANGIGFIRKKGELCLQRIAAEHSPTGYEKFLESIVCPQTLPA